MKTPAKRTFKSMKLTDLADMKEVRSAFKDNLLMPEDGIKKLVMRAEPKTKSYTIVGTAFEYFILSRLYRDFKKFCLNDIPFEELKDCVSDISWEVNAQTDIITETYHQFSDNEKYLSNKGNEQWLNRWQQAEKHIQDYLEGKEPDDNFYKALITAAELEIYCRSGYPPFQVEYGTGEIEDLKNLMSIFPLQELKPQKYIWFDPVVGGPGTCTLLPGEAIDSIKADGDLIIDDKLIDIKTIQKNSNNTGFWCQLVGYYLLFKKNGVNAKEIISRDTVSKSWKSIKAKGVDIKAVGVYFSRHGKLQVVDIKDLFASPENETNLQNIFSSNR